MNHVSNFGMKHGQWWIKVHFSRPQAESRVLQDGKIHALLGGVGERGFVFENELRCRKK